MAYDRRLPVYLLLDCSESMVGEAIDAVQSGLQLLVNDLRNNPMACPWCHTRDRYGVGRFEVG